MKNDNFYEDDELNESYLASFAGGAAAKLLMTKGGVAVKGLRDLGRSIKPTKTNIRKLFLKDPDKKVDLKTVQNLKNKLDKARSTATTAKTAAGSKVSGLGQSKMAKRLNSLPGAGKVKTVAGDAKTLWDASNKKGKAAMIGAGIVAGNEVYDKGETLKSIGKSAKQGTEAVARLTFRELPAASKNAVSLILSGVSGAVGGMGVAIAGFNNAVRSGRITYKCIMSPSSCEASIIRSVTDYAKRSGASVAGAGRAVANASTGTKVAGGVATLAAAAVAAKIIKDALERKEWYNNGCEKLGDPKKKEACLAHIQSRQKKELEKKLKRCKVANNPDKCEAIVRQKLNSMEF